MSAIVTVDTSDTDAFFSDIDGKVQRGIGSALADAASEMQDTTTSLAPVETGFMQSQIRVSSSNDSIDAEAGADYSSYVDQGTSRMSAEPFFEGPVTDIANHSLPDKLNNSIEDSLGTD